jgi:hypothetical protein
MDTGPNPDYLDSDEQDALIETLEQQHTNQKRVFIAAYFAFGLALFYLTTQQLQAGSSWSDAEDLSDIASELSASSLAANHLSLCAAVFISALGFCR